MPKEKTRSLPLQGPISYAGLADRAQTVENIAKPRTRRFSKVKRRAIGDLSAGW